MEEKLKKQMELAYSKAEVYTGKLPRTRKKSSLHQIIKTKEQADRLMKMLRSS